MDAHVNKIDQSVIDQLINADGWEIESFDNEILRMDRAEFRQMVLGDMRAIVLVN